MARRTALAVEATFILFVLAAAIECLLLKGVPFIDGRIFAVAASIPALASVSLIALIAIFPSLLPLPRLTAPAAFTLPIAHAALTLLFSRLALTADSPLQSPGPLRTVLIWQNWRVLLLVVLLQTFCLTIFAALTSRRKQVPS